MAKEAPAANEESLLMVHPSDSAVGVTRDARSPAGAGAQGQVRELSFSDTPDGVPQAIGY
jgi:hypothetical protein